MNIKTIFVYNSPKLFDILDEIKSYLSIEVYHVSKENYHKINESQNKNYIFISDHPTKVIENNLVVIESPKKILKLIEQINLNYLKINFNNQSFIKIGKYNLDLNSRLLLNGDKVMDLTEKECNMLIFINENKKVSLKKLQENVWNYASNLETHTVETHVYRLRKKISKIFKDDNFIKYDKDGYYIKN